MPARRKFVCGELQRAATPRMRAPNSASLSQPRGVSKPLGPQRHACRLTLAVGSKRTFGVLNQPDISCATSRRRCGRWQAAVMRVSLAIASALRDDHLAWAGKMRRVCFTAPGSSRLAVSCTFFWPAPERTFPYWIYDSRNDFHSHKWRYDFTSLLALLASAGCLDTQRKTAGDSQIENVAAVEDRSRILHGAGRCVRERKP